MKEIDPILLSVLQRRLKSITQEMGLTLLRTTRSPILNEARDFVTGLYDAQGRMLEQTEYIPILAFALQPVCQYLLEYYGDEIYPGDVILHNDVFTRGNQMTDVAVYVPIFHEGRLAAWAACKGHQSDIGGGVPGGYNPNAREVWQEGIRITPVKVYEKGKFRKDVWDMVFANVRFSMVADDIRAEIGGCVVGERGVKKILERYGREVFDTHVEYLFDSTERMMRKEIGAIPDGVYQGESYMFFDGITDGSKYRIAVTITKKGEDITFDFTGTDPQSPGYVNAPLTAAAGGVILTFLMCINPEIPHNEGMIRPIHVHIPEGTLLNARYPSATTYGNHLSEQIADAIFKALAPALPEKVTAGWNRLFNTFVTGTDPQTGRSFVVLYFLGTKGGSGGTYGVDGYDYIGAIYCAGGLAGQDYEMFEIQGPNLLQYHEYWQDSGGAGQWRGGLGTISAFNVDGENMRSVTIGDGVDEEGRGFGLFGGQPGTLNRTEFIFPDGGKYIPKTKEFIPFLPRNTKIYVEKGGGGGFGDPYLRPVEKVWEDVKNGFVSAAKARDDYGVVIDPDTLRIDQQETERLRSRRPVAVGAKKSPAS